MWRSGKIINYFKSMADIKPFRNFLKPRRNSSTGWWTCTFRRSRCLMNTTRLVNHSKVEIMISNIAVQVNFRTRCLRTVRDKRTYPGQSPTILSDFWHFIFFSSSLPSCSAKLSWASPPSSQTSSVSRITWQTAIESLISQKEIQYWGVLILLLIIWLPSDLQICCDSPVTLLILQDNFRFKFRFFVGLIIVISVEISMYLMS